MELPKRLSRSSQFHVLSATDSEILGPSDSLSLSLPSEPPDIRNWFPNYEYESPKLDSEDLFGGSICQETEFGNEEVFTNCSESEKDEEPLCEQKNIELSHSGTLLSEPIHARNWFSNYVYESPVLDTSDGFGGSAFRESECMDGFAVENQNKDTVENYKDSMRNGIGDSVEISVGLAGNSSSYVVKEKQEKPPLNKENTIIDDKNDTCFWRTCEHSSESNVLKNHGIRGNKCDAEPNLDRDDARCTQGFSREVDIMSVNVQRCSKRGLQGIVIVDGLEVKSVKENGFSSPKLVFIDSGSKENSARKGNSKENIGNETSSDGFVTTRKGGNRRGSEVNRLEMPKTKSLADRKYSTVNRDALAERTNFLDSNVNVTAGKWKCPQKRKQDFGPPLKQLRLERWVHRM